MKCKDCKHYKQLKRKWGNHQGFGKCEASKEYNYIVYETYEKCTPIEFGWIKKEDL